MQRSKIIKCYSKTRTKIPSLLTFIKNFPEFSTKSKTTPEFKKTSNPEIHKKKNSKNSSINETVSFCSKLSRIKIDRVLYKEILNKRQDHSIFLDLEEENPIIKKWYYINLDEIIEGPYNSFEMNNFYVKKKINERTKIKRSTLDDDYFFLSRYVKRYFKKILEKKLNLEKDKRKISNKIQRFRKGKIEFKKYFTEETEFFEAYNREERTHSLLSKPNLVYLVEDLVDDEDDNCFTRVRASTNYVIGK